MMKTDRIKLIKFSPIGDRIGNITMKALINYVKGLKNVLKKLPMVVLLLVFNLLFALILAVPLYHSLDQSFEDSLVRERMVQGFDYLWWLEFRDQSRGLDQTFTPAIIGKGAILNNLEGLLQFRIIKLPPELLIVAMIYIFLHTFLAGGILTVFQSSSSKFSIRNFFSGAGTLFPKMALILGISWLCYLGILGSIHSGMESWVQKTAAGAFSEITVFRLNIALMIFFAFLFFAFQMMFDYFRIFAAEKQHLPLHRSMRQALRFIFKHPGSTFGLYYLFFFTQVMVTVLWLSFRGLISQTTPLGIMAGFLAQQVFFFTLIGIRCWQYSGQMELRRYLAE